MTQDEIKLAPYEARLTELWERMVKTIGIYTVNVLMERAIWEASQKHPEMALIKHNDEGLTFDAVDHAYAGRPEGEVAEAFNDLTSELLLIMARLLGREMAQRLAEELQARISDEKKPGGEGKVGS